MLVYYHKSTATLVATLTDNSGGAVSGATVIVTILDDKAVALVTDATMVDQSDGTYTYTITNTLLPIVEVMYVARVTAVAGGATRYSAVAIHSRLDTD